MVSSGCSKDLHVDVDAVVDNNEDLDDEVVVVHVVVAGLLSVPSNRRLPSKDWRR